MTLPAATNEKRQWRCEQCGELVDEADGLAGFHVVTVPDRYGDPEPMQCGPVSQTEPGKSTFTPGPWRWNFDRLQQAETGFAILTIGHDTETGEPDVSVPNPADAELIRHAPALFAALEEVLNDALPFFSEYLQDDVLERARVALSRARGGEG